MKIWKFRQSQTFNWYTILWLVALIVAGTLFYQFKIGMNYIGIVEKKLHSLGPQEPGKIQALLVQVGDRVKKDQVIAVLDMSDLKVSLDYLQKEFNQMNTQNKKRTKRNLTIFIGLVLGLDVLAGVIEPFTMPPNAEPGASGLGQLLWLLAPVVIMASCALLGATAGVILVCDRFSKAMAFGGWSAS